MFRCQGELYCTFKSTSYIQSSSSCAALLSAGDTSGLFIYSVQFIQAFGGAGDEAEQWYSPVSDEADDDAQVVLSKKRCAASAPMDPY